MNLPVLDFATLWRGMRCPRQLRAILDSSTCFNPKLCSGADLVDAGIYPPSLRSGASAERLDLLFTRHQDIAVQKLAATLFSQAKVIEADSLWSTEGETLRELGWLTAGGGGKHKPVHVHKDNWPQVLARLPGLSAAGFLDSFLWASPDYLFQEGPNAWIMLLVRSGPRVRDSYIAEAGFIQAVLARKGLTVSQCLLLGPGENYQRAVDEQGNLLPVDPAEFFELHSLNHAIKHQREPLLDAIPRLLTDAKADKACDQARTCPLCSQLISPQPEHSVHTLHRGGKAVEMLESQGILDLHDIDRADAKAKAELKDRHFIQINSIRQNLPHVDKGGLAVFLKTIKFPVFFLDFESTSQAVPPAAGVRPWEHIPFMFSAHQAETRAALGQAGMMESSIHLMDPLMGRNAQLAGLCRALVAAAGACKTVLVYGGALESHILTRLGQIFPENASRLAELKASLVDLQVPFQQFHYYHPKQYGKLSLKKLLPLLSRDSHLDLDLQSGGEANLSFYCMANPESLPEDLRSAFIGENALARLEALRQYCGMDTWGLVQILSTLYDLAG